MSLSPQWLDELRSRVTLSGLISRTTRLTKAGREFKACCPFHSEKSPSFTVNDEKGFYHCFGCGAHGDAIRWMTDQRGLSFMDAVKELAAEAGMDVPVPDPRAARAAEQRDSLHDVTAAAQKWFVDCLASAEGEKARAYLATRGFDAHTLARFGFGYAPEGRQALKAALSQFPEDRLIEAGLRIAVEDKEPYDRFRGRLMLPIEDARGRVIAFGGRILDETKTDAPKYLNSPDTPLFDKGRTLYNLHRAGPASRQSGRLIVVEGYMDVIALAAAGFTECVAPLGTALTERQIEMLWRLVETPILCFDGDAAGQRAAMRAVTRALPLLRPAHSLRIVRLPAGLDPDDLVKRDGAKAMEAVLAGARSLIDTLWEHERDAAPLVTPEDKAGLKARLLAHVETIADRDIQSLYRRELLERFSAFAYPPRDERTFSSFTPSRNAAKRRNGAPPIARSLAETRARLSQPGGVAVRGQAIAAVVAGLIRLPEEIARHAERLAVLARESEQVELLIAIEEGGHPLDSEEIATIFAERGFSPGPKPSRTMAFRFLHADDADARAELADAIVVLVERPAIAAALAAATELGVRSGEDWEEQQRLRRQLQALDKRELDLRARLSQTAGAIRYNSDGDPADGHRKKAE